MIGVPLFFSELREYNTIDINDMECDVFRDIINLNTNGVDEDEQILLDRSIVYGMCFAHSIVIMVTIIMIIK